MPSLAPQPRFRFFTAGGSTTPVRPLVGGKVYFYEAGTTTPKDTYTDASGVTPNTNPVVLNARGEADIWLGLGSYKMVVTDAAGVQQGGVVDNIKSIDQIESELVQAIDGLRDDLANVIDPTKGAAIVGFGDQNYIGQNVGAKLREFRSIRDKGAATSAPDNLTAVNAAIADQRLQWVPPGDFSVSAGLTNTLGTELRGPGRIEKPVSGGNELQNLSCDLNRHVFGQEYLWYFHDLIRSQTVGSGPVVVCSGDSTTAGDSTTSPFRINELVQGLAANAGYIMSAVNRGQSGKHTGQWLTTYLAGDMALNPDLLILRWGINDPGWLKDGSAAPPDAGQNYPNRRDITNFAADLRAGLTLIRSTRSVSQLSILLMVPNSTYDIPNGRDANWYEQVRLVVRQAARDFECACIDTYSLWPDSKHAAGIWMDDVMVPGGRAIHPKNMMNAWIATEISNLLFPRGIRLPYFPGSFGTQPAGAKPDDYMVGVNMHRVLAADGWPGSLNGGVITLRTPDTLALQIAWDYTTTSKAPAIRFGQGANWQDWVGLPVSDLTITGTGWITFDSPGVLNTPRLHKSWRMVTLSGAIKGGTTTVGHVLMTLPAGSRPFANQWFSVPCGGAMNQLASILIAPDGKVMIQSCPDNGGLSLSGIHFEAFN